MSRWKLPSALSCGYASLIDSSLLMAPSNRPLGLEVVPDVGARGDHRLAQRRPAGQPGGDGAGQPAAGASRRPRDALGGKRLGARGSGEHVGRRSREVSSFEEDGGWTAIEQLARVCRCTEERFRFGKL